MASIDPQIMVIKEKKQCMSYEGHRLLLLNGLQFSSNCHAVSLVDLMPGPFLIHSVPQE